MFRAAKKTTKRQSLSSRRSRPQMTAYYRGEQRLGDASPFIKKSPKPQIKRYVFGLLDIILIAIIFSGLIYSLIISPKATVVANDYTFHKQAQYQAAAASQLSRLNNRNKITFNENSLVQNLQSKFPEIRSAQVELPLFSQRPTIRLDVGGPSLVLVSLGKRYVIDSQGKAVAMATDLPKLQSLPIVSDSSNFKISLGAQVLGKQDIGFIKTIVAECGRAQIKIAGLNIPAVPEELDMQAQGQSYFVKYFLGGDALIQTGQYLAAQHHFSDTNQQPGQYLDVRVPGKVFYK